jgi:hypothetical protein
MARAARFTSTEDEDVAAEVIGFVERMQAIQTKTIARRLHEPAGNTNLNKRTPDDVMAINLKKSIGSESCSGVYAFN